MAVALVRHTTPLVADGVCYGMTDLDLAETFEREADVVLKALPRFDVIVSSPLQRCQRLAAVISDARKTELRIDDRVREMDFGHWEGRRWTELPRAELDAWASDFLHARPHGGESVAMLRARTHSALSDIRDTSAHALIVTHSGVIKAALATGDRAEHFSTNVPFGGVIPLPDELQSLSP